MSTDDGEALRIVTGLAGRGPDQTGFVVPDVRAAARDCVARFGMRPWAVFFYGDDVFRERTFRGAPGDFTTRSAVWGGGRMSFVEPVSGASSYAEALADRGPGLHHAGYFVDDLEPPCARLIAAGGVETMRMSGHGLDGDGALAFVTVPGTTIVAELIVRPVRRREPDEIID